jgi:hypothetical protein
MEHVRIDQRCQQVVRRGDGMKVTRRHAEAQQASAQSWNPAWRAANFDPMQAIRSE